MAHSALVVNRPTDMAANEMVRLEPPVARGNDLRSISAGRCSPSAAGSSSPMQPDIAEYRTIHEGLYLSASPDLLRRVLEERPAPRARVIAGYAGWGPGQLDEELAQSSWLIGDLDVDLIFDVEASTMWDTAIRRLGADPSALQSSHGIH